MASDLSKLIKEGLCSTLNGLLAKEAILKETNLAIEKDFNNLEVLKVESTFEFKDITSTWSFIVPAFTASYIFNIMVGDESEPALAIDDDMLGLNNHFSLAKNLVESHEGKFDISIFEKEIQIHMHFPLVTIESA